jgi:hypothetical protein
MLSDKPLNMVKIRLIVGLMRQFQRVKSILTRFFASIAMVNAHLHSIELKMV